MDATAVVGCFRDRTILVTGSTGFLGKCMQIPHILVYIYPYTFYNYNIYIYTVLVEKILRVQPNVKKLYLVVRASDAASAEQRILSQVKYKRPIAFYFHSFTCRATNRSKLNRRH